MHHGIRMLRTECPSTLTKHTTTTPHHNNNNIIKKKTTVTHYNNNNNKLTIIFVLLFILLVIIRTFFFSILWCCVTTLWFDDVAHLVCVRSRLKSENQHNNGIRNPNTSFYHHALLIHRMSCSKTFCSVYNE